jgi:hypothetical protein
MPSPLSENAVASAAVSSRRCCPSSPTGAQCRLAVRLAGSPQPIPRRHLPKSSAGRWLPPSCVVAARTTSCASRRRAPRGPALRHRWPLASVHVYSGRAPPPKLLHVGLRRLPPAERAAAPPESTNRGLPRRGPSRLRRSSSLGERRPPRTAQRRPLATTPPAAPPHATAPTVPSRAGRRASAARRRPQEADARSPRRRLRRVRPSSPGAPPSTPTEAPVHRCPAGSRRLVGSRARARRRAPPRG